ncbi:unnamed protein product, partial [Meganyctiphanes norvegica]
MEKYYLMFILEYNIPFEPKPAVFTYDSHIMNRYMGKKKVNVHKQFWDFLGFFFQPIYWLLNLKKKKKKKIFLSTRKKKKFTNCKLKILFPHMIYIQTRVLVLISRYEPLTLTIKWPQMMTTAGSCVFLIAKTLLYHLDSSYPFEVLLILISFLIAWAEAWFVDFRILPQEARARSIVEAATNSDRNTDNEDTVGPNMERVRDYLSHYTESVANFYSPLESPAGSDDEDFDGRRINRKLSPQDSAVVSAGAEALQKSIETLKSGGWKLEKETSHGDTVHSKLGPRGTKIYMVQGIVDAEPEIIFKETLQNFEKIPTWNKSLTKCELIQTVDSNTDVIYQVAAEGPGGVVSARDFVNVRYWKKVEDCWISAGMAVVHPEKPPQKKLVRGENGPGCWSFGPVDGSPSRCHFRFLLDTELKGWIPQYVLDQALTHTCTEFMTSLRAFAA